MTLIWYLLLLTFSIKYKYLVHGWQKPSLEIMSILFNIPHRCFSFYIFMKRKKKKLLFYSAQVSQKNRLTHFIQIYKQIFLWFPFSTDSDHQIFLVLSPITKWVLVFDYFFLIEAYFRVTPYFTQHLITQQYKIKLC